MAKGAKSTLNNNDLWELPHKDQAVVITKKYDMYKPGMAFGTCKLFMTCKKQIAIQLTYGLLWSFTMFATPIFFYFLLNDLNNTNKDESHAWLYLAGLIASMVVSSICNQLGNMAGLHTAIQFKTIISNEIFKMCLKRRIPVLSNTDATTSHFDNNTDNLNVLSTTKYSPKSTEWDSGAVANLLNTDVNVLGEVMSLFHMFVGSTLQVIIAFSLLWCITGPASLFGLLALVIICILVGAKTIASPKYVSSYREACGKRLSIINEMLQSLRIIKLFAWEQQFCARIDEVREKELSVIWNYYVNFAIHFVGSTVSPVFVTVATLGTYTMLFGNTLNSTTAFTSIVLLESLRTAINQWSAAIYYYLQYRVIIQRITAFLSQPVLQSEDLNRPTMNDSSSERIGFINGEFSWNSANSSDASSNYSNTSTNYSNTSASSFCLNDLDIDFITGELNIITGQLAVVNHHCLWLYWVVSGFIRYTVLC
ncbi:ABC transporter type 1, transmembrane domain-containing protein [Syncephalis fuscata]|nr:ABC transporter type 1, transmembrane domain-containing protein [Syncephalis fuscata]